jgi:F-type H+-transporting ATPase subunit alpha
LKIKAEEISEIIKAQLQGLEPELEFTEVGTVTEVGDGVARLYGLEKVMAGELIEFPDQSLGLVLNLEEDSVSAILLGQDAHIKEGDLAKRTRRIGEVPVGSALLGRVVNPLGQPLDGKGPIKTTETNPLERLAPGVVDRRPVKEPLQTGTDHWRSPDGQDRIGRGHHIEPEELRGLLHLCGHRAKELHCGPDHQDARGSRCYVLHYSSGGERQRSSSPAVSGPVRGLRHGRILS